MLPGYHRGEAVTSRSLKCDKLSTKYGYVHPGTYGGLVAPLAPSRRDLYVVEFAVIISSFRRCYYDCNFILVPKNACLTNIHFPTRNISAKRRICT